MFQYYLIKYLLKRGLVIVPLEVNDKAYNALSDYATIHDKVWRQMNSSEVYRVMVKGASLK